MGEMSRPCAETLKVAIACQGGGSHAAYAAGVLSAFLQDPWFQKEVSLVGLSGTSGGAVCAALTWSAHQAVRGQGWHDDAADRLQAFWSELSSPLNLNAALNEAALWFMRWGRLVLPGWCSVEAVNPFMGWWVETEMRRLLDGKLFTDTAVGLPLFIGATNLDRGEREVFQHPPSPAQAGSLIDHILASAAVPPLYAARRIDGNRYWDGLFTTNPPIRELAKLTNKPEEIWVIRINPKRRWVNQFWPDDVLDRRNELAGNTALEQEIAGALAITDILNSRDRGKPLSVRRAYSGKQVCYAPMGIFCVAEPNAALDLISKFDTSRLHIRELYLAGKQAGKQFVRERQTRSVAVCPCLV